MRIIGVKPVAFLVATVLILLASSLPQAFATTTLAYDNGTWDTFGGDASAFAGVRFSLPSGVSSANLRFVRWGGQANMAGSKIHITQANHVTELSGSPISVPSLGAASTTGCPAGWPLCYGLDVTSSGIVVTGDFFVIFDSSPSLSELNKDTGVPLSGRSYDGASLATLGPTAYNKNFLLRVDIDPITPVIPEYPLGLPILAIFMVIAYGVIRRRTATKQLN